MEPQFPGIYHYTINSSSEGRMYVHYQKAPNWANDDLGRGSCDVTMIVKDEAEAYLRLSNISLTWQLSQSIANAEFWMRRYEKTQGLRNVIRNLIKQRKNKWN